MDGEDERLADDMDAAAYEEVVAELAAEASDRGVDAWDAVGEIVPGLTRPVCERVLEHAVHEPAEDVVAEVVDVRESDDAERLRARAITSLVADVRARAEADG